MKDFLLIASLIVGGQLWAFVFLFGMIVWVMGGVAVGAWLGER